MEPRRHCGEDPFPHGGFTAVPDDALRHRRFTRTRDTISQRQREHAAPDPEPDSPGPVARGEPELAVGSASRRPGLVRWQFERHVRPPGAAAQSRGSAVAREAM